MSRRLLPDGLAGRFALLLIAALLAANLVALSLMSLQRVRLDREALRERELERVVALVPGLEAADPARRAAIARDSSTRFSRVTVDAEPLVTEDPRPPRSAALTRTLAEALPDREVRAAILRRPDDDGGEGWRDPREVIVLSIALAGPEAQWVNMRSRGARPRPPTVKADAMLAMLLLSLACVLAVGLVFVRRLTEPLGALARAARAAGQGDRSARVPETGAREMREAATAFNAMQTEISQFEAERMRMLAAVGHDLRTPMTSLRIRAEMVEDDEQRDAMIRTLDEMGVMANGLVAFAREGHDGEEATRIDLGALLAQVCADRGADFEGAGEVPVTARRVGLARAFGNLVDNAIRYGGSARVRLSATRRKASVTIEDTGPGIPPNLLESVFQPFRRGDESRSQDTGGAGLGLSIARTVIATHGGSIRLENRASGGLRVLVELPLEPGR
jgi:signal transduction histidine kinase